MGMISLSTRGTKGAESVLQQICVGQVFFATFFYAIGGYPSIAAAGRAIGVTPEAISHAFRRKKGK